MPLRISLGPFFVLTLYLTPSHSNFRTQIHRPVGAAAVDRARGRARDGVGGGRRARLELDVRLGGLGGVAHDLDGGGCREKAARRRRKTTLIAEELRPYTHQSSGYISLLWTSWRRPRKPDGPASGRGVSGPLVALDDAYDIATCRSVCNQFWNAADEAFVLRPHLAKVAKLASTSRSWKSRTPSCKSIPSPQLTRSGSLPSCTRWKRSLRRRRRARKWRRRASTSWRESLKSSGARRSARRSSTGGAHGQGGGERLEAGASTSTAGERARTDTAMARQDAPRAKFGTEP